MLHHTKACPCRSRSLHDGRTFPADLRTDNVWGFRRVRLGLCIASQHSTVPVLNIRRETTTRTFANRWKERVHAVHAVHAGCPSMVARDYAAAWLVPDMPLSRAVARAHAIQKNTDYHESTLREPRWTPR